MKVTEFPQDHVEAYDQAEQAGIRRQVLHDTGDPLVVGPEVMAPVGDAMGLVDHEHANAATDAVQHLAPKGLVRKPFG